MENQKPIRVDAFRTMNPKVVIVAPQVNTESKPKNKLFSRLSLLVLIVIALIALYLFWKASQIIGFAFFVFMFFSTIIEWVKGENLLYNYVGINYKDAFISLTNGDRQKKGLPKREFTDKEVLNIFFKVFAFSFVFKIIYAFFVLCFALDPKYQMFPLNILGLLTFLVCFKRIFNSWCWLYNCKAKMEEIIVRKTFRKRFFKFMLSLICQVYVLCVFLVFFGILGKVA